MNKMGTCMLCVAQNLLTSIYQSPYQVILEKLTGTKMQCESQGVCHLCFARLKQYFILVRESGQKIDEPGAMDISRPNMPPQTFQITSTHSRNTNNMQDPEEMMNPRKRSLSSEENYTMLCIGPQVDKRMKKNN